MQGYEWFFKQNSNNMSKIGVAVVGYGRMGLIHARNVDSHPKLELKYIVGTNQNQVEQIASQFNNVKGTIDYNQVLNDPQVKGVVICSPSGAHFAHITEVNYNQGKKTKKKF